MKDRKYTAARVRSASFDADANTIDIIWSTGADVLRQDWNGSEYIERLLMGDGNVRLGRLNSGAPFLDTHASDTLGNVIGSVVPDTARIKDGKGLAKIQLSGAASDADTILKIREGVIKNISVGYWVHHSVRQAGEDEQPDLLVIDDWEPLEVSAVAIPADEGAQIRSASRQRPSKRLTPQQRGAAAMRAALQPTQSRAEAKGAAEARKALSATGTLNGARAKAAGLDPDAIKRGARAARRLLRGRQ